MNKVVPLEFIDLLCFSHIECSCFSHFEGEFFEGDYESLFTFIEKYLAENYELYEELSKIDQKSLTNCPYFSYYILLPQDRPSKLPNVKQRQSASSPTQFFLSPNHLPDEEEEPYGDNLHILDKKPSVKEEEEIPKILNQTLHPQEQQIYQPAMNGTNKLKQRKRKREETMNISFVYIYKFYCIGGIYSRKIKLFYLKKGGPWSKEHFKNILLNFDFSKFLKNYKGKEDSLLYIFFISSLERVRRAKR